MAGSGDAAPEAGLRPLPPVDSEAAIRRDKEVHELGLHTLATMPPQDMLRLLQDACRELQLHDAALLPAALRKMCRALAALPPMEAFVRDVCAVALSRGAPAGGGGAAAGGRRVPSTKLVLQTLKSWVAELRQLHNLQDFVCVLSDALRKRTLPGGVAAPGAYGEEEVGAGARGPLREISSAIEELVQQERRALIAIDSFKLADEHIGRQVRMDPADTLRHIVTHFGRLFGVTSTEGHVPKMNELHRYTNEQRNFQKVLKSMVGVEEARRPTICSRRCVVPSTWASPSVARCAHDAAPPQEPPPPPPSGASAPSAAAAPSAGAPPDAATASAPQGGPHSLPQYVAIAAELRKLTKAPSVLAIVPAVKELIQMLAKFKQSNTQMRGLIQQLCATLSLGSAEALIAERMQALAEAETAGEA